MGKRITVKGIGILRFSKEDKVVEGWDTFDQLGRVRQPGAIPSPEQSEEATLT